MRPLILSVLLASAASAQLGHVTREDDFSYTYVEVDYVQTDYTDQESNLTGYEVEGSIALLDHLHAFARWNDGDLALDDGRNLESRELVVGGGANFELFPLVDVVLRGGYVTQRYDDGNGYTSPEGFMYEARARALPHRYLELQGAWGKADIGNFEVETTLEGKVLVHLHDNFALTATYRQWDVADAEALLIGVRLQR